MIDTDPEIQQTYGDRLLRCLGSNNRVYCLYSYLNGATTVILRSTSYRRIVSSRSSRPFIIVFVLLIDSWTRSMKKSLESVKCDRSLSFCPDCTRHMTRIRGDMNSLPAWQCTVRSGVDKWPEAAGGWCTDSSLNADDWKCTCKCSNGSTCKCKCKITLNVFKNIVKI